MQGGGGDVPDLVGAHVETSNRMKNGKRLCCGETKKGKPCRLYARPNTQPGYCWIHATRKTFPRVKSTAFSPRFEHPGRRYGKSTMEDLDAKIVRKETAARMACIRGSAEDKPPCKSWMRVWLKVMNVSWEAYNLDCDPCIVENCESAGLAGGHLWLRDEDKKFDTTQCYIGPMCDKHNKSRENELPRGFHTKPGIRLAMIRPHSCYLDYGSAHTK